MLATFGLSIICVAWFYQFCLLVNKKDASIKSLFVGIYAFGVLLLVIDGLMSGLASIAWLNFVSLFISVGVLVILLNKKQKD